ncbi:recombinase family protein [Streptomyces sp. YGL11-2]|uniref:recombinase family protein n=1 Tax=Streptomyces sp. YGL11-2 TaxID=3414028 RepID=UPI003CF76E4A
MPPAALATVWEDFEVPAHARGGQVTLNLHDHLASYAPKRPGAYLRISSDRFGLEAGVDRQMEDAQDTRSRLHWGPFAKIYKENDTSAFKKRKITKADGTIDWVVLRPEFRQLLADLTLGVIDGVIFYDLDRLVRQPRDLEDLIDIVEYVKRPVTAASATVALSGTVTSSARPAKPSATTSAHRPTGVDVEEPLSRPRPPNWP